MSTLIIIRHGESLWNLENKFAGWKDIDLSDNGIKEAINAGKLINESGIEFDIAYTSVLKRAIKTLWYILDEINQHWIPVHKIFELNERHYGGLTGLNKTETSKIHGEDKVFQWRRSFNIRPPKSSEEFHNSMNINVYSAYLMTSIFLPKMLAKKNGNIIIVSSGASSVKGAAKRFIYGTTKAALNGFVKAIAIDYVKKGIRCNAILPGTVQTPSWEQRVAQADDPKQAKIDFITRQAMGRLAQPEEIASLGVYLASDESDFVTGTLNLIDGGWTL